MIYKIEDLKKDQWLWLPVSPRLNIWGRPCIRHSCDEGPGLYKSKIYDETQYILCQIAYAGPEWFMFWLPKGWGKVEVNNRYIVYRHLNKLKYMQCSYCDILISGLQEILNDRTCILLTVTERGSDSN